jgi:hypothetical protein
MDQNIQKSYYIHYFLKSSILKKADIIINLSQIDMHTFIVIIYLSINNKINEILVK